MNSKLLNVLTAVTLFLMPNVTFGQAPTLGSAANFVLFTSDGAVTNLGTTYLSYLTGNVGSNSGSITGFGNVNGVMHAGDGASGLCAADLLTAYNQLNTTIPTFFPAPLLGDGDTLTAGVYHIGAAATLNLNLILNAQGDPGAVFIFQIEGSLSTGALSKVIMINGGLACNVFWKVEGLVSMGAGSTMRGTIVANNAAINMGANDTLEGRALSTTGAITTNEVMAYTPTGCGSTLPTGPAAPALASTACYGLFSSDGPVANSGITHVTGDVGTNVGLTTGYNPLFVTTIHPIPDGSTAACAADLLNVYNYLETLPYDIELLFPAQFGHNLVLTPHTYVMNAATTFTDSLYLDAEGDANAVFVIQINGALITSTFSNVLLINGTQAKNVYWKVDGAVTINDNSVFNGTIICNNGAILLNTGVTLNGRALTTTGAVTTAAINVNVPPGCGTSCVAPAIGGTLHVCPGATTALTDSSTGGTWSSNNTLIAMMGSSGVVTGIIPGNVTITYTSLTGCVRTAVLTVNPLPSTITGPAVVCAGATIILADISTGGVWSSSNTSLALVGTGSGIVTGVAAGIPTITYNVPGACIVIKPVTVGAFAGSIAGASVVCIGSSITLTDAATGGVWSSSNTRATVLGGVVTGVTAGVDTIRYAATNACGTVTSTKTITINPLPIAGTITGITSVCAGSTTTLTDIAGAGIWSGSNTTAMVLGDVVTGVTAGIDTIRYVVTNTCGTVIATKTLTVNPLAFAGSIAGLSSVCIGSAVTLTDIATGGVWSGSNARATVLGSIVTGVTAGIDTIRYAATNACGTVTATKTITINPLPIAGTITGVSSVCAGSTTTLTDTATGGIWSASNATAMVLGDVVTGVTTGMDTIKYIAINTCGTVTATKTITVNPLPIAGIITGISNVCAGSVITLTDMATGGIWSSSNTRATVLGDVVTGATGGTDTIRYIVTNVCGTLTATKNITVNPLPDAGSITSLSNVCIGLAMTLTDVATGGVWSSSNARATVSGDMVTGVTAGVDSIRYSVTNVCGTGSVIAVINIDRLPVAGIITGADSVCVGNTITLADIAGSGIWSSSSASYATVAAGGSVTGVSSGVVMISYSVTNVCGTATAMFPVNVVSLLECSALTNVAAGKALTDLNIYPNPNNGVFTVNGSLGTGGDEEVSLEITNMLGQVVYNNKVIAQNGNINESVQLGNTLAGGMYILNVRTASANNVFQFMLKQQ